MNERVDRRGDGSVNTSLTLRLHAQPIERIAADLAVVGVFEDERPLRRGAGRLDWRLCGLVSELLADGVISGKPGEALLTPTLGRLRAERALLLGLGQEAHYGPARAHAVVAEAVRRGLDLGANALVMAPLGVAPDDLSRIAESLVSGALESLQARDASVEVRLALPVDDVGSAARALEAAAGSESGGDVAVLLPSSTEPIPALAKPLPRRGSARF